MKSHSISGSLIIKAGNEYSYHVFLNENKTKQKRKQAGRKFAVDLKFYSHSLLRMLTIRDYVYEKRKSVSVVLITFVVTKLPLFFSFLIRREFLDRLNC